MGKRPDQLKVDDREHRAANVADEPWFQFSREIDQLLATGQYQWAEQTLLDIQETVERTLAVTPGQRQAVENIENGTRSRRYDGFRRRYR